MSLPLLIRTAVLSDEDPTLVMSFNLNYLPKGPICKLGARASTYESWGGTHNSVQSKYRITRLSTFCAVP